MAKRILLSGLILFILVGCVRSSPSPQSESQNTVIDTILDSFSAEDYKAGVIPDEALQTILQCGQKATSSWNLQPWHFTVIRSGELISSLLAGGVAQREYKEGNVIIVISGMIKEEGISSTFDCALATQNMYLAAQALGYGSRLYYDVIPMINSGMKDSLGIPEGYEAQIYLYIGNVADGVDATASASPRNPLGGNVNYID